jgi:hypothetical protein
MRSICFSLCLTMGFHMSWEVWGHGLIGLGGTNV